MANFSSLKQTIQNYIKENGNKEITGNLLQEILLSMVVTMGDQAINGVLQMLSNEVIARENADGLLSQALTAEQQRAIAAETKSAVLDGETKTLVFKNAAGQDLYQVSVASLVTTGLVDVEVDGTNLVMTFHTESGDEEITIPISDIFSPSNYYTKTQVDNLLLPITTAITNVSSRLNAGYIYLGLADPETIPTSATGKFFYIASQAGTYHFMSNGDIPIVISSNGLYILSGGVEADDWYLETIVTFTNNVQLNNAQLITSGGVFNAINPINELLHRNYILAGVAETTTIPTDDTNVFYLAGQGGTYTHFLNGDEDSLVLPKGLTVIYRGIEDDGWNYWVAYADNDFINTNRAQALTSNQQTEAQNNLEGKLYEPAQFSGLGKKMLAKNIQQVGGVSKNVMTQAFFEDDQGNALTNTVFVIQYDYELGEDIEIGEGCTLQFDGGSITGAGENKNIITLNDTIINAEPYCIFKSVILNGNYGRYFQADWFESLNDCVDSISVVRPKIRLSEKSYFLTKTLVLKNSTTLEGVQTFDYDWHNGTIISFASDVDTTVNTCVIKVLDDDTTEGSAANITIKNIVLYGDGTNEITPTVDGIVFPYKLHASYFENIKVYHCVKAYSLQVLWDVTFNSCNVYTCTYGLYFANAYGMTSTEFNRCVIYGVDTGIYIADPAHTASANFSNCAIDSCRIGVHIKSSGVTLFTNLSIEGIGESAIVIDHFLANATFIGCFYSENQTQPTNHTTYIKNAGAVSFINCNIKVMPVSGKDLFYTETNPNIINFINTDLGDSYSRYSTVTGSFKRYKDKTILPKQIIHPTFDEVSYTQRVVSQFVQLDGGDRDYFRGTPTFIYEGKIGDIIEFTNMCTLPQTLHKDVSGNATGLLLDEDIVLNQYDSCRLIYIGNNQFKSMSKPAKQVITYTYSDWTSGVTKNIENQVVQIQAGDRNYINGTPAFTYNGAVGDIIEITNMSSLPQTLRKNAENDATGMIIDSDIVIDQYDNCRLIYIGNNQFKAAK